MKSYRHKTPFSRQLRQFRALSKEANRLLKTGAFDGLSEARRDRLQKRLRHLYASLSRLFAARTLQRALAGAALLLGVGTAANAQTISMIGPTTNPYNLSNTGFYLNLPELVDIDADGDLDCFSSPGSNVIQYFENTGSATAPNFAAPVEFPFGLDSTDSYYAFMTFADLDADGDQDILVGEYYGLISYYENVGDSATPAFAPPVYNAFGLDTVYYIAMPELVDLDDDGDFDLLVGENYGNFQYFENIGDSANALFASPVANPFGLTQGYYFALPTTGDLDADGDLDLVIGVYYGELRYFENTGTASAPAFAPYLTNPFGLQSGYAVADPEFADLDGDGDLDLLVGVYNGDFEFYKHDTLALSAPPVRPVRPLTVSPNPASDRVRLAVEAEDLFGTARLTVLSGLGRMVLQQEVMVAGGRVEAEVDLNSLAPGTYIARLKAGEQVYRKRFVKQ